MDNNENQPKEQARRPARPRQGVKQQPSSAAKAAGDKQTPSSAGGQQAKGAQPRRRPSAAKSAAGKQAATKQPAPSKQSTATKQPAAPKQPATKQAKQTTAKQGADKQQATTATTRKSPNRRPRRSAGQRLRIIPLGGMDQIGRNITVIEYGNDIIIVDCGSSFPDDDMPGVDLVIPDIDYLIKNRDRLRAMIITHGHEDHIGSIPHVLKMLGGAPVPIYGTRLTLALIAHKLKEHRCMASANLVTIKAGDSFPIGAFVIEGIHVNHSITDSLAFNINTPMGNVVITGDFKIDYTPIDGQVTDLKKFADLGRQGVLALMMDSTNVERPGYTMSERTVGETFDALFPQAKGRIIIAMFSSNVHRVQQVIDSAVKHGRMVCLTGRSMLNYSSVAQELGLLKVPFGRMIDIDDLDSYVDDEVVIVTTGSQGENMAGLSRMAFDEHRKLSIRKSDTVVFSSHPIPGNEKSVSRVINQLFHKGANVIYESLAEVHVSGHACQEELKLIHALVTPKYFVPMHGEYRHLKRHAQLARSMGMPQDNVIIASIGDVIEFGPNSARIAEQVQAGQVLLDGSSIGDVGNVVLRDRKLLSQDGLLVVVLPIDFGTGALSANVELVSRGFVYMRESEELLDEVKKASQAAIIACQVNKAVDINAIKNAVRDAVRDLLYKKTKRTPMVLPVVVQSKGEAK